MTTSLLPHLIQVSVDDLVTSFLLVSCMFRKLDCVSTPDLNFTLFLSHAISKQWPDHLPWSFTYQTKTMFFKFNKIFSKVFIFTRNASL